MQILLLSGALAIALTGAVWDVRTYRIPNGLTYPAMVAGLAAHLASEGWRGLLQGPGGLLVGGGIFLVFYLLRTLGAGDVKLMAAVGAWVGLRYVVQASLYSAIAGGICALLLAVYRGRFRQTMANIGDLVRYHTVMGAEVHPTLNLENPDAQRFPYGVAIFGGTLVLLISLVV